MNQRAFGFGSFVRRDEASPLPPLPLPSTPAVIGGRGNNRRYLCVSVLIGARVLTAGVAWFVGCAGGVEEGREGGTVLGVGRGRISSIVGVVLEEGSGHFSYRRGGCGGE